MQSADVMTKVAKPITKGDFIKVFKQLNLADHELLMVYADLQSFDYVIGGA